MKHGLLRIFLPLLLAAVLTAALAACRDDDGGADGGARATLTVWLSLPEPEGTGAGQAQHRLGDPGEAVPEDTVWDCLTLLLVYEDNSVPAQTISLTRQQYEALPPVAEGSKLRRLQLDVPEGKAYLYGATGNQGEPGNPAEALYDAGERNAHRTEVEALTIRNDYAKGKDDAVARKVSVATGFYHTAEDPDTPAPLELTAQVDGQPGDAVPTLTLTRLATKIDVQWDAADAVLEGVMDVRVEGFRLDGGHGITGPGSGRLFPTLYKGSEPPLMGSAEFTNTTDVSQRNGRVYHYVFSDGVSQPSITFRITAQDGDSTEEHDYELTFGETLRPAAWYKVNATIKGFTGTHTLTIFGDRQP